MKRPGSIEELLDEIQRMRMHVEELAKAGNLLRNQEEMYREMVHSANSIILCWDARGRVTFINRFAQEFFGFAEAEIIGRSLIGTIVPKSDARGLDLSEMMKEICANPEKFVNNENENIKRDGERVWISWTNKPIYDHDGNFLEILSVGNDITRRKKAEDELERLASTDTATGTLNRRAGLLALERAIAEARARRDELTVGYLDVNNLKPVNDQLGHHEGDELIRIVCDTLKSSLRATDIICRMGGDEFMFILPDCPLPEARQLWNRFARRLSGINQRGIKRYPITVSHGFAEYHGSEEPPDVKSLIAVADAEMYRRKQEMKAKMAGPILLTAGAEASPAATTPAVTPTEETAATDAPRRRRRR